MEGEEHVLDIGDGVRADMDNNDVAMRCGWKQFERHRLALSQSCNLSRKPYTCA